MNGSALAQLATTFANALTAAGAGIDGKLDFLANAGRSAASPDTPPVPNENATALHDDGAPHDDPVRDSGYTARDTHRPDPDRDDTTPAQSSQAESGQGGDVGIAESDADHNDETSAPPVVENDDADDGQSATAESTPEQTEVPQSTDAGGAENTNNATVQTGTDDDFRTPFNEAHANLVETARSSQGGQAVREAAHAQVAATPGHLRQAQSAGFGQSSTAGGGQPAVTDPAGANPSSTEAAPQSANATGTTARGAPAQSMNSGSGSGTGPASQMAPQSALAEVAQNSDGTRTQQAAGLAKAMGNSERVDVRVSVTDAGSVAQSRPTHTLSQTLPADTNANSAARPSMAQIATGTAGAQGQLSGAEVFANTPAQTKAPITPLEFRATASEAKGVARLGATNGQTVQVQAGGADVGNATAAAATQQSSDTVQTARTSSTPQAKPNFAARHAAEQVSVQISKAVKAGIDRINIQLKPASLGRIEVQLEMTNGSRIAATIIADRPDTLDMLQRDARGLEKSLLDAGLDLDAGGMNFSLRGQQNNNGANHDGANDGASDRGYGGDGLPEEAAEIAGIVTAEAALQRAERAASRGGVDVQA